MASFVLYLAILLLFFFLLFKHRNTRKNPTENPFPSGPPGLPIIGNLHQLDNSALHCYLWKLSKKYGPIMSLRLGSIPTIVISSARVAEEVFKIHGLAFSCRPRKVGQQKLSYNGKDLAFQPLNDYRRYLGKICSINLFSSSRVKSFRSIREEEVDQMIKRISKLASDSSKVNVSEIVMRLTSTIICRIAFGKIYDYDGHGRSRFHSLLNDTQAMLGRFFVEDYYPLLGWVDKLNGNFRRLDKIFKKLDLFYQEVIEEHIHCNKERTREEDFIDVLLKLKNEGSFGPDCTLDHIKAMLLDVFIAGTDTSAATTIWAMTTLVKKPTVMKKAQHEVRELVGRNGFVTEDYLSNLPYLKAVVKETLRLYTPAPLLLRQTTHNCVIQGYKIPAKTLAFINAWAIGRDPEAWVDPEEFSPERFIGSFVDFKGLDYKLLAFGAGRRKCPGIELGVVIVELALANLLYSFEWKLADGMKEEEIDTDVLPGLTMHKKTPLCLVATNVFAHA